MRTTKNPTMIGLFSLCLFFESLVRVVNTLIQRLTTHFHPRVRKHTVHIDISQDATKWTEILA